MKPVPGDPLTPSEIQHYLDGVPPPPLWPLSVAEAARLLRNRGGVIVELGNQNLRAHFGPDLMVTYVGNSLNVFGVLTKDDIFVMTTFQDVARFLDQRGAAGCSVKHDATDSAPAR